MENYGYEIDDIVRYLKGNMSDEEKKELESAMEESPDLKNEVDFHRTVMKGMELKFREDTKEYLKNLEAERAKNNKGKVKSLNFWKVACLLLIIGGGFFLYFNVFWQHSSPQAIAQKHFEPYPNHLTNLKRSGQTQKSKQDFIDKAMSHYSAGRYEKAMPFFKKAVEKANGSGLLYFYMGNAYLSVNKPEKAVQFLEKSEDQLPKEYEPKRQWFLALAYLWDQKQEKTLSIIKALCEGDSDYYCQKGMELKGEIKNN